LKINYLLKNAKINKAVILYNYWGDHMKKGIIILTLLILLVGLTHADLKITAESVENSIYLDEQAVFYVFVNNTDSHSKNLNIFTSDIKWYVDSEPSPANILGNQKKKFTVTLLPSAWAHTGSQSVKIIVESPNSKEKSTLQVPVFVKSYDDSPKEYSPSIELRISYPKEIDPREPIPLELYIRNRNRLDIKNLQILINSELINDNKIINLEPLSETKENMQYMIDPNTKPKEDILEVSLIYNNKTVNRERINHEVIAYSEFKESQDKIKGLFKISTDYIVTNNGNIKKKSNFKVHTTVLQKLFTKTDPKPDTTNLKNQYFEWSLDLQPNEEAHISVVRNYRPALYLILMSIIVLMVYFIYRSPVLIKKESIVVGPSDDGISEMKVLLHLRNRSAELIENLTLTDLVSPIANLVKQEHLGTLEPTKILKHHKKGTIIKWEFEVLEPFEERIISYRIKTRMTIVGGLTLPSAKIKFLRKDTERVVKSNKSQVSFGL
jgi:hypothetical protein